MRISQGTDIPDGAHLVFRAYGPQAADAEPVCEVPFFTSEKIEVTQAGVYRSGTTTVSEPGNVYWVETLYDADGDVLHRDPCGAPNETTKVLTELQAPPGLAITGGTDLMRPILIAAAFAYAAAAAALHFGRRLAKRHEEEEATALDAYLPTDEDGEDGNAIEELMR
ncbi:MAG: hypothetical protein ACK5LO_17130 [Leucobacter sp.]